MDVVAAQGAVLRGWDSDRYFDEAGTQLEGDLEVVGTDDPDLYLTQRSDPAQASAAALPTPSRWMRGCLPGSALTLPSRWGSPGGPEGRGRRVFSVTAEVRSARGSRYLRRSGGVDRLVKQAEVDVQDGELNLSFTASEGEPSSRPSRSSSPRGSRLDGDGINRLAARRHGRAEMQSVVQEFRNDRSPHRRVGANTGDLFDRSAAR